MTMYSPECDSDQDTQGTASPDDGIDSMSQLQSAQNNKLDDALGLNPTSNRLAPSQLDQHEGHGLTSASALRKVSEQLLSTSRTRASLSAPLTPRPLAPASEARPSSIALPPGALARQPGPPRCLPHPHKPAITNFLSAWATPLHPPAKDLPVPHPRFRSKLHKQFSLSQRKKLVIRHTV